MLTLSSIREQPAVAIEIHREGVHCQSRCTSQCHSDEAAMELVRVLRVLVILPSHRLAGIPECKPEDNGANEDILDRRLELSGSGSRDHDAATTCPPAERRHCQLPANQQQTDPQRNAAPDRNVVKIVTLARDPVDGYEGGEEQQLVSDRVEQLAEVGDLIPATGEMAIVDVADSGHDENGEGDQLGPIPLDERQQCDHGGKADSDQRNDVGQVPHDAAYPKVLTTFLLMALRVSNTPSPVKATASK